MDANIIEDRKTSSLAEDRKTVIANHNVTSSAGNVATVSPGEPYDIQMDQMQVIDDKDKQSYLVSTRANPSMGDLPTSGKPSTIKAGGTVKSAGAGEPAQAERFNNGAFHRQGDGTAEVA